MQSMRAKLITIFFITFTVFVGLLVWRFDDVLFGDRLAMNETQVRGQMAAVVKTVETEIRALNDVVRLSLPYMDQNTHEYKGTAPLDRVEMIAKLSPPSAKNGRKEWQVITSFFQEGTTSKPWAPQYIFLSLKTIKEENLDGKKTIVLSLLDPKRKPHILVLTPSGVEGEYFAGLVGAEIFQGLMDRMKGQSSAVYVVNQQGQALGHTVPEYVGSLLSEDPLVASLMASQDSSHFGSFKDLRGESVQGLYEQVGASNVFAVIATPAKTLLANREFLRLQFLMMGLGLALVGVGIFVFMYKPEPAREAAKPVAPANAQAVLPSVVAAPLNKMEAYVKVASSLAHEMRGPLTSILGHVQLMKTQGPERAAEHVEKIEREARAAREIVTKLQAFTGEGLSKTTTSTLDLAVNKALKAVEGKILNKGIKLQKNIVSTLPMNISVELVAKAIENILLNSIESMERAPKKTLEVSLKDEGATVILEIKDSGEGIQSQDLSRIFDPFYTTKAATNHVGLGLATTFGIFKEFHGELSAVSERTKGTTIRTVFTPEALSTSQAAAVPVAKPAVAAAAPVKAAVVAPVPEVKPAVAMNPLLIDNAIDKLIDGDDDQMPQFPPPPKSEFDEPMPAPVAPQAAASTKDFSAKIDKPKIELKKKSASFEDLEISIRRPGEKA